MAHSKDNIIMRNTRGAIGKQVVFKNVNGKTIAAKYPDMSQVQYNEEQLEYRKLFAEAVAYAKSILYDTEKKAAYQEKILRSKEPEMKVYPAAIREFMALHSRRVPKLTAEELFRQYLLIYPLSSRQKTVLRHLIRKHQLTNALYQHLTKASKATATRDLKAMVELGILTAPASRGAGAIYRLVPLQKED